MTKPMMLAAVALLCAGCTNQDKTQSILESQGYTDIESTGYRVFRCGKDDHRRTQLEVVEAFERAACKAREDGR